MRVNAAAVAARALSRSLACSDALTFSTHSHRFHLQSVTHLNRRKRHEPADDDPRTMWSPAAVAGRLSSSTWLVVVLLCAITLRVVAAGATITSQMSPRVVQTQYAILPHPNGISIGSADFAGLTVAVQTQYGRLRGVLVSIADPTSSGQPARRVEVYLGLQYASLLGGRLRFMPPTGPMEKWDGGPQRSILARIFSSSRPCLVSGDNISTRCASV